MKISGTRPPQLNSLRLSFSKNLTGPRQRDFRFTTTSRRQGSERQVSKERSRFDKIGFKLYAKPINFSSPGKNLWGILKILLKT